MGIIDDRNNNNSITFRPSLINTIHLVYRRQSNEMAATTTTRYSLPGSKLEHLGSTGLASTMNGLINCYAMCCTWITGVCVCVSITLARQSLGYTPSYCELPELPLEGHHSSAPGLAGERRGERTPCKTGRMGDKNGRKCPLQARLLLVLGTHQA